MSYNIYSYKVYKVYNSVYFSLFMRLSSTAHF